MKRRADKLCRAIDDLLVSHPRKTLVAEPEVRELLQVASLRRHVGRMFAAIGAPAKGKTWQQLEAIRKVR